METFRNIFALAAILFLIPFSMQLSAQDTIHMVNGSKPTGKVIEVGPTEIRYKKADNPDGPTFVILKRDVAAIHYQNGTKETMVIVNDTPPVNPPINQPPVPQQPTQPVDRKIYPSGSKYMTEGQRIGNQQLENKLLSANDPMIDREWRMHKTHGGLKFLSLGAIPTLIGGVTVVLRETIRSRGSNYYRADYGASVPWFAGGVAFLAAGTTFTITSGKHKAEAIRLYNQKF